MVKVNKVDQVAIECIETPVLIRNVDAEHVAQLAASMERDGQETPITVHVGIADGKYVLGPGLHRLEAARKLGWTHIAAIVKPTATPQQIRAEQMRENLHKNLTPLEEAELAAELLEQVGDDVDEAAAIMGCTPKKVELRAALTRLSPVVRGYVDDGALPLSHAQTIAQLADHARQEEIARYAKASSKLELPMPLRRVRDMVAREGRTLANVTWRLNVAFGSTGRACDTCPQNSKNSPGLFDGDTPKARTCLEASCYAEKSRLSGSAARKAANWIVNEKKPRTKDAAKEAAEAREVPFVVPDAVLRSAVRVVEVKKARETGEAPPAAEPKKETAETKAKRKHDEALRKWEMGLSRTIEKKLVKAPIMLALIAILERGPGMRYRPKPKIAAEVKRLIKAMAAADTKPRMAEVLLEAAQQVDGRQSWYELDAQEYDETIAEALGIEPAPKPALEDFLPKKAPATTKKKAKRKAAAKSKKKTTKKKARKKR